MALLGGNTNYWVVEVDKKFWEVWGILSGYWQKTEQVWQPSLHQKVWLGLPGWCSCPPAPSTHHGHQLLQPASQSWARAPDFPN